ncbi:hypothetical protein Agub_g1352, partial [Astrephomene gubernaculifera]
MASFNNFTLDDEEEPQPALAPEPVTMRPAPGHATAGLSADVHQPINFPTPTCTEAPVAPSSLVAVSLRESPKSQVDADLCVGNLAEADAAVRENQRSIEETEAQLQALLRHHARLMAAGRLLEQQKVLDVLALGSSLGYDTGRPTAALLVYRCCLRWGCFSGDAQAAAVLDNLASLLHQLTDDDSVNARHVAAAAANSSSSSGTAAETADQGASAGDNGGSSSAGGDEGKLPAVEAVSAVEGVREGLADPVAEAAAREVAYWLAVTSTLLALVDPHLPLVPARPSSTGTISYSAGAATHGSHSAAPTPLAVVTGEARASMARAAATAAAKMQELQKRMGNTFSVFGKNLLARRRGGSSAGGGAAGAEEGAAAAEISQEHQAQGEPAPQQQPPQLPPLPRPPSPATHMHAPSEQPQSATLPPPPPALSRPHTPSGSSSTSVSASGAASSAAAPAAEPYSSSASGPSSAPPAAAAAPPANQQCFRQQLDLLLLRTYNQMRDSLKRHVSAVLLGCVQQQPMSPMSPMSPRGGAGAAGSQEGQAEEERGQEQQQQDAGVEGGGGGDEDGGAVPSNSGGVGVGGGSPSSAASLAPWAELVAVLSAHLELMRAAHVPRILIRCLFKQTLSFLDCQLFNQLLLRPECCCTSNAHYLVAGLALLETWLGAPGGAAAASASASAAGAGAGAPGAAGGAVVDGGGGQGNEDLAVLVGDLRHIRQAAHFLVLANKGALRLDDITAMCPALNVQQLYRLATTFWDDSPQPPVPPTPPRQPLPPPQQQQQPLQQADGQTSTAAHGTSGGSGQEEVGEVATGGDNNSDGEGRGAEAEGLGEGVQEDDAERGAEVAGAAGF